MSRISIILLIILLIIILLIIILLIMAHNSKNKYVYNINNFPIVNRMHNDLMNNFNQIVIESKELLKDKINNNRKAVEIYYGDVYSGTKIKSIINGSGWTIWDNGRKDWYQYPIVYNSKMLLQTKNMIPTIYKIIEPYKNNLHSLYVSILQPNGSIDKHYDGDHVNKTLGKKILSYHLYLDAPPTSIIGVHDKEYIQKTGEYFIFDNTKLHWVKNNSNYYRIAIVCKFYD